MRASILTFLFIMSETFIITGGHENCGYPPEIENAEKMNNVTSKFRMRCEEGYIRKPGTSNLFKCENNKWRNIPTLECTRLDTGMPPVSPLPSISAPEKPFMDRHPGNSIPTTNVFTTTHNVPTTSRTFHNTSQRTTTLEEASVTTSITDLSSTENEKLTTMCSISTESTEGDASNTSGEIKSSTKGLTGGIVLVAILGVAATAAILLWRRRLRRLRADGHAVEMSIQDPLTPFKDTPESTYTDASLSA